nr:DNA-directed DNA polymerase [Tanacetum cinerariifolium]
VIVLVSNLIEALVVVKNGVPKMKGLFSFSLMSKIIKSTRLFVDESHVGGVGHDVNVRSLINEGAHALEVSYAACREFLEKPEHLSHPTIDLIALLENGILKSFHSFDEVDLVFELEKPSVRRFRDDLRCRNRFDRFDVFFCFIQPLMVVEAKVLNNFLRFVSILIAEFAAEGVVNLSLKMKGDMIIKNLDLKPTIGYRCGVLRSFSVERIEQGIGSKILSCGDGSCWKAFKPIASLITLQALSNLQYLFSGFINYLLSYGEGMINSIQNGDQPLPVIAQVSLAGNAQNAPPTLKDPKFWTAEEKKTRKIDRIARSLLIQWLSNEIYSLIDSNKTAKDLWDALERQMRGSEYGEQDRKAVILYEYETFKATEGERLLDTYLRYLQVINDLKKCGYKKDNCELNYKFLNNLQPEWKHYGTLMRQTKNLMDINILKQNQGDVNDALGYKKKVVVVTSDPLALVAEKTKVSKRKEKVVVSSDSEGHKNRKADLPPHLEYEFLEGDDKLPVRIAKDLSDEEKTALIKVLKSYKRAIAWKLFDIKGINSEFYTHQILMEEDFKPTVQHQRRVNPKIQDVIKKEGGFTIVENEENELILTRLVMGLRVCIDYRKLNEATRKDHFSLPFIDQMLKRLAGNEHVSKMYDGYLSQYDRKTMEVFMDDFLVFGNSFGTCLSYLEKTLKWCEDTNLCLNWEKSHFMIKEGIVLGHKISKNRMEVDKAKVDVIAKLAHPTTVKGIRSFFSYAGFYRRFIQDFSKIARPITRLLEKDTPFFFSKECVEAFQTLKKKLTEAPILIALDWDLPFELMCDTSDFVIVKMSRDVLTVGSTMRIPLLYRGEYSQWVERFMNYLEEQINGEAMINSIMNGDQPLPGVTQVSITGTTSTEQPPLKDKSMCNKTAKDLWDALARHMLGSEYGEQDRKVAVLYEYETFKATKGELLLETYIRYLQVINDLKKCGYSKDNYVNDAMGSKKKIVVVTSVPLALIAEKTKVSKSKEKVVVSSDSERSDADDFSELKKITALLAKAFNRRKFYSNPTNNNLRTSSTSQSANKKQKFVKNDNKTVEKKYDKKKQYMSRFKCYNCKKEGHFAKDCKKVKVKDYEYYKTKMLLAKKDKNEQVLLAEDQAWMESR